MQCFLCSFSCLFFTVYLDHQASFLVSVKRKSLPEYGSSYLLHHLQDTFPPTRGKVVELPEELHSIWMPLIKWDKCLSLGHSSEWCHIWRYKPRRTEMTECPRHPAWRLWISTEYYCKKWSQLRDQQKTPQIEIMKAWTSRNEILSFFPQFLSVTWQQFDFWAKAINLALQLTWAVLFKETTKPPKISVIQEQQYL